MDRRWFPCCYVTLCCFLFLFPGSVTSRKKDEKPPYLSQFPSSVTFRSTRGHPFQGQKFEYLRVSWLRQTQNDDNRTLMAGYDALDEAEPEVTWLLNGRLIHEDDRTFAQEVTTSWFRPHDGDVNMASITIPHAIRVTSLQLLLVLNTTETLTDINVQNLQDLDPGLSIMEIGNDVALALSAQENVKFDAGDDVKILARFFAEDMTNAVSVNVSARFLRMLPTNPDVTLEVVTSHSHPDVMRTWEPGSDEVPPSLHKNWNSTLMRHMMLTLKEDHQNVRGLLELTASYATDTSCRLFGGQTITHRAFIRAKSDKGGYWGRGGPVAYLPFPRYLPVTCGSNIDISITAFGEISPDIYLVKNGRILQNGHIRGLTIFLFRCLLQTKAVFRFENIRPEISGRYVVWAENRLGSTEERSFALVLDEEC